MVKRSNKRVRKKLRNQNLNMENEQSLQSFQKRRRLSPTAGPSLDADEIAPMDIAMEIDSGSDILWDSPSLEITEELNDNNDAIDNYDTIQINNKQFYGVYKNNNNFEGDDSNDSNDSNIYEDDDSEPFYIQFCRFMLPYGFPKKTKQGKRKYAEEIVSQQSINNQQRKHIQQSTPSHQTFDSDQLFTDELSTEPQIVSQKSVGQQTTNEQPTSHQTINQQPTSQQPYSQQTTSQQTTIQQPIPNNQPTNLPIIPKQLPTSNQQSTPSQETPPKDVKSSSQQTTIVGKISSFQPQSVDVLTRTVTSRATLTIEPVKKTATTMTNDIKQLTHYRTIGVSEDVITGDEKTIPTPISSSLETIMTKDGEKLNEFTTEEVNTLLWLYNIRDMDQVVISKFDLNVTVRDIRSLTTDAWVNDVIINFYLNLISHRAHVQDFMGLPKVYPMNSFFFPRLSMKGFSSVARWTRKKDIFEFDYIPVPIHLDTNHWSMVIVNVKKRTIKYYDSMNLSSKNALKAIKDYLESEHFDKKQKILKKPYFKTEYVRDCPQQTNFYDCGVFACMFANYACKNKEINFTQENIPYFRKRMTLEIINGQLFR